MFGARSFERTLRGDFFPHSLQGEFVGRLFVWHFEERFSFERAVHLVADEGCISLQVHEVLLRTHLVFAEKNHISVVTPRFRCRVRRQVFFYFCRHWIGQTSLISCFGGWQVVQR